MNYYIKAYYRSYFFRLVSNFIFMIAVHYLMKSSVEILPRFHLDFTKIQDATENISANSSYLFDETSILITLTGLILVALMSLLIGLGTFQIIPNEGIPKFRIRLLLYTLTHLSICTIITLYLFFIVGVMSSISSYRINQEVSFIWLYPFYAIIILCYLSEAYGFMTKNIK